MNLSDSQRHREPRSDPHVAAGPSLTSGSDFHQLRHDRHRGGRYTAEPEGDPPEHGRIEIRDERYHDPERDLDIENDGILENQGTINVHGNLEINDAAELINDEGASIVVNSFLRLAGGAQLSNSGDVTVEAGARVEVVGADFANEGTIVIMAEQADEQPDHGCIEVRDDRYHDEGTDRDSVTPGILLNKGTITVGGNLEINDGGES